MEYSQRKDGNQNEFRQTYRTDDKQNGSEIQRHDMNMVPNTNQTLFKQFQTLKQINRILDSNPLSEQAKDQKIRSLVVMLKRQLDINKKLQNQVQAYTKKLQGKQQELFMKITQCDKYQTTIYDLKQKLISLQISGKKNAQLILQNKQEIIAKDELIQRMRQSQSNQKYSMQNQLHYLKRKTLQHFTEKLNFPLQPQQVQKSSRKSGQSSQNQSHKLSLQKKQIAKNKISAERKRSSSKSKKKDLIRKNILAISQKQNGWMSGQNLMKKFSQDRSRNQRFKQIQNGRYYSNSALNDYI